MEIPEKIYRNIQQQVAKNQCDIRVLKYGLKIIGTTLDVDGLTSIPALEGESALVGEPGKQKVYIFLDNKWKYVTDLASDVPGPKGDKGATGEAGERGSYWFFGYHEPDLGMDPKDKDMYLNGLTGDVYQFNGKDWGRSPLARIIGPQGIQGPRGYQGDVGPQGPKGDKGDVGFTFVIRGKVASEDLLPDINSLPANSGYLVGETDVSLYIVQIDPTTLNRTWLNVGVLLSTNAIDIAYDNASSGLTATNLQASTDELAKDKLNKNALQWTTLPEGAVDKKTFYNKTISTLRTANNKIYMFGTPEETPIKEFFDIWEKPTDFKATHVYIIIKSISNTSSRDSFKMTIHSSNYGNMYYMVVNGYSSQLVGTSGWISYNLLSENAQKQLAKNDGLYELMTVGVALGLIDPLSKEPTISTFTEQITANNTSVENGVSVVNVIGGNTIIENQILPIRDSGNAGDISVISNGDGTYTLNGEATRNGFITLANIKVKKHKMLWGIANFNESMRGKVTLSNANLGFEVNGLDYIDNKWDDWVIRLNVFEGQTYDNLIVAPEIIDLTQWFGFGNEPTSVEEAYKKGIAKRIVPYNINGTIKNATPSKLESYNADNVLIDTLNIDTNKYFPNGMDGLYIKNDFGRLSAEIRDTLTKDKATKNLKKIKLADLTWRFEYGRFIAELYDIKMPADTELKGNMVCNLYENKAWLAFLEQDNVITMRPAFNELAIRDSSLNGDLVAFKEKIKNTELVYELVEPIITDIAVPLDYTYFYQNGGIEKWDSQVPIYTEIVYKKDLVLKLAKVLPYERQHEIDTEQDRRLTDLENVTIVNSTEIGNIEIAMKVMPTREQVMINHKFIGNLHDIDLYNQIINTPNVMDGALFRIDIQNDTPRDAVNRGFPNLEQDSVVYGYFYNGQLDSPMIVITEQGLFKVIDGASLSCSKIGATEELPLNFTRLGKNYKVQLDTTAVNSVKKLKVWYEFYFLVSGSNVLHCRCDEIEFTSKSNADVYIGMIMPSPNALSVDLALVYNKASGVLQISTSSSGAVIPDNIKIVDVKGVR